MMHKNPNERIKISQIKDHLWFSFYKVSFQEITPDVAVRQSNLITDSMLLEGEDPFDDFMNKRLKNSNSSGGKSQDDSKNSLNAGDSDFGNLSAIEETNFHSLSFKKQERFSDLTKEITNEQMLGLEVIPEEKGVNYSYRVWRV